MKIATFNVNNINKRLQNLLRWIHSSKPDIVFLQELKCMQCDFPAEALRNIGYEAVWCGERSWNGVAILAREHAPVLTRSTLPGDPEDLQARYIEAAVNGILFASIYLPNGNPQPGPKFKYKLIWVRSAYGPRRPTSQGQCSCSTGWRLQCRTDPPGHLRNLISRQKCSRPA